MPRGYWRYILAVVGCLILSGNAEQHRTRHHKHQQQQTAAKPPAVPQSQNAPSAEKPEEHCYGSSQPWFSCDAISAQAAIDQARDADEQAAAIEWQFRMSALTLAAAVLAVIFARGSVTETRRIGEAQTRAYLSIDEFIIRIDDLGRIVITFSVRNSGTSPARDVRWSHKIKCKFSDPIIEIDSGNIAKDSDIWARDIPPNKTEIFSDVFPEKEPPKYDLMILPVAEGGSASAEVTLIWTDVFDNRTEETTFYHAIKIGKISVEPWKMVRDWQAAKRIETKGVKQKARRYR
jgi:hypothetical protein